MNIITKPAPTNDYFQEVTTKTGVMLHFTAGYTAESARITLDKPDHVAVHYIVDLNGDVWYRFDRKYWGYHLGMKSDNPGHEHEKRTIAIEVVNIGPVWNKGGVWKDYVGKVWPEDKIVKIADRGAGGYVKFPDAQVNGVIELVGAILSKEPNIWRRVPKDKISYQVPKICHFNGIMSHQMFRKDKYDMGPAWPWQKMIDTLNLEEVAV